LNTLRVSNNPELRVLHIVESFGGGVYIFLKNLLNSKSLKGFRSGILFGDRGEVDLDQLHRDFPSCELTPWQYARRAVHPYFDWRALQIVRKTITNFQPRIIHCHSSKAGALGRIANWGARNPCQVIYSPHGLSFLRTDT